MRIRDVKGRDWMPVLPHPEVARQSRELADWHAQWVQQQLAAGSVPFNPEGRPEGSDYNQHYVDLEASPEALDEYLAGVRRIKGLDPQTGAPLPPGN